MSRQRLIINGKKYYQHPVFSNYAASKDGEVINVKTVKILKMINHRNGYLYFSICDKKLEKPSHTFSTDSLGKQLKEQYRRVLKLII